jgi:hypothetical protein
MYVYCAISKNPKHLPNCLTITETSVVLIISKYEIGRDPVVDIRACA